MKPNQELADYIITGDLNMLYKHFLLLDGEYEEFDEDYKKVRFGLKVLFSIYDTWEKKINEKGDYVIVKNPFNRKYVKYLLEDYRTEISIREKIMREAIYKNTEILSTIMPR